MARLKPIGHLTARQEMWNAIRALADGPRAWQLAELAKKAGVPVKAAHFYLARLRQAGIVQAEPLSVDRRRRLYRLARDLGVEAPRIDAAGTVIDKPTGQERMWAAMKTLRDFAADDLVLTADVRRDSAVTYIIRLAGAGYLARTGQNGRYRLLPSHNTGPRAPAVRFRDKAIFDLNLGRVVSIEAPP